MESLKDLLLYAFRAEWKDALHDDDDVKEQLSRDMAFFEPYDSARNSLQITCFLKFMHFFNFFDLFSASEKRS